MTLAILNEFLGQVKRINLLGDVLYVEKKSKYVVNTVETAFSAITLSPETSVCQAAGTAILDKTLSVTAPGSMPLAPNAIPAPDRRCRLCFASS